MIARILLRNSTDRQAKADTIASQRAPVRELVARHGADEVIEYVEEAVSGGTPLDERDVLRRLLADAQPGELVGAFDLSRLTRSDDWEERYKVLGAIRRAGLRPVTAADGAIDLQTVGGRMQLHIRAEMSSTERDDIKRRMHAGRRRIAAEGYAPEQQPWGLRCIVPRLAAAAGVAPGWRETEAAAMVREVYALAASGMSCDAIAGELNRRGVKPPRGARWLGPTALRLIRRACYSTGLWDSGWGVIPVPVLVDPAIAERARENVTARKQRPPSPARSIYLLEGVARCSLCGEKIKIRSSFTTRRKDGGSNRHSYYVCAGRGWRVELGGAACPLPRRRTDAWDAKVWGQVVAYMDARGDIAESAEGQAEEARAAAVDLLGWQKQLDALPAAEAEAYEDRDHGRTSREGLRLRLDRLAKRRGLLEQQIASAGAMARAAVRAVESVRERQAALATWRGALAVADPRERRELLRLMFPAGWIATPAGFEGRPALSERRDQGGGTVHQCDDLDALPLLRIA